MRAILLIAALLFGFQAAWAQPVPPPSGGGARAVATCGTQSLTAGTSYLLFQDLTGTLCAAGGGGGSATPFVPNGNYGTLTATAASSASTAMPAGAVVAFQNMSLIDLSCVLSAGTATATTNKIIVRGGATVFVAVGSNVNAACINQTGVASNAVSMAGGAGLGTNFGGGSSGGGGGAVTLASGAVASGAYSAGALAIGAGVDGWDIQVGPTTATAATVGSVGSVNAKLRYITTQLDNINTGIAASIPAGAALIGDVNLRQGGTALSAANGIYANQLQGNAVLSATNPSFSRPTDGTNARVFDPCEVVAHVTTPISISSAATSVIVAGTSAKKTYICSIMLMSAGTTNVGIVQGSGSTCGTSTLGLIGGATAATGPNLTAQAGFVAGNGNFAVAGTTVNANDVCLINSLAIQVSGYIVTATP